MLLKSKLSKISPYISIAKYRALHTVCSKSLMHQTNENKAPFSKILLREGEFYRSVKQERKTGQRACTQSLMQECRFHTELGSV